MRHTRSLAMALGLFAVSLSGCAKPCDPITESATAKRLGIVLPGGRVCKEEKSVASIDYPSIKGEELASTYRSTLGSAGWSAELVSEGTLFATKDADTLFIVTGKKSKDRRVPFAVVRYCENPGCRAMLQELANAMKK